MHSVLSVLYFVSCCVAYTSHTPSRSCKASKVGASNMNKFLFSVNMVEHEIMGLNGISLVSGKKLNKENWGHML